LQVSAFSTTELGKAFITFPSLPLTLNTIATDDFVAIVSAATISSYTKPASCLIAMATDEFFNTISTHICLAIIITCFQRITFVTETFTTSSTRITRDTFFAVMVFTSEAPLKKLIPVFACAILAKTEMR